MTTAAKNGTATAVDDLPPVDVGPVADTPDARLTNALSLAQGEFPPIAKTKTAKVKTKTGGEYSYSYADLADVLHAVRPVLARHGLAIVQRTVREGNGVVLVTELRHVGGGVERTEVDLGRNASDPQQFGGALTYLRRYELVTLLGLSPEDDRDAQDVGPAGQAAAAAPPPPPEWALGASPAAIEKAYDAAIRAVGQGPATSLLQGINDACGDSVPVAVARTIIGLVSRLEAAGLVEAAPSAPAAATVPQPEDDPPPPDMPAEALDLGDRPAPGRTPMPPLAGAPVQDIKAMRDAGCICDSPLEASRTGEDGVEADSSCPISGHGIAF